MRKKITLDMTMLDMAVMVSEGNPGALSVIMQLSDNPLMLLDLDDMNIRGIQVWVGYKDHCGEDIDKFKSAVKERDAAMVNTINENCVYQDFQEIAVECGASFNRG